MNPQTDIALTGLVDIDSTTKKGSLIVSSSKYNDIVPMWNLHETSPSARLQYSREMGPLLYLGYRTLTDSFWSKCVRHHFLLGDKVFYVDAFPVPRARWTPENFVAEVFSVVGDLSK